MREHHHDVIRWLSSQGATAVRIEPGRGKHPKLRFSFQGKMYSGPIAGSPRRPWCATRDAIRQLRHRLGLVRSFTAIGTTPFKGNERSGR
jgi:hypothetical protein